MSDGEPRRIRVARPPSGPARIPARPPTPPPAEVPYDMQPNAAGRDRAGRQLLFFSGITLLLLLALLAANELSPYAGARESVATFATLGAFALLLIAYAYVTTLLRAPRATREGASGWTVFERNGRLRTFTSDAARNPVSLRVHPPDFFCGQWTETVVLQLDLSRTRAYLLERGLRPGSERLPTTLAEGP